MSRKWILNFFNRRSYCLERKVREW